MEEMQVLAPVGVAPPPDEQLIQGATSAAWGAGPVMEENVLSHPGSVTVEQLPSTTGVEKVIVNPPVTGVKSRRTFHDSRLFIVVSGVAAVLVAALMLIIAGRGRYPSNDAGYVFPPAHAGSASAAGPTATPATPAAGGDAVAWIQSNLGRNDSIATDPAAAAALTRAGFTHVSAPQDPQHLSGNIKYVLTHTPSATPALQALLAKSIPVAAFGSGSGATTVSQVEGADAKALARMVNKNRDARAAAGRQLALNSRLTVASKARSAFLGGSIDLRAETLLALLTQNGDVRLDAAPQSDAERRAQVPIRTVVVTVGDVTKARHTIDALPPAYHARSTQLGKRSQLTVQFPVQGVPAMPVS